MAKKKSLFPTFQKWSKKLTHKQILGLLAGLFTLMVLPLAIIVVQQEVRTRSDASEGASQPKTERKILCTPGATNIAFSTINKGVKCPKGTYTKISFRCNYDATNTYRTINTKACSKTGSLTAQASTLCTKNFPCQPVRPTPPAPTKTPATPPPATPIPADTTPPTLTIDGPYEINGQTCMRWIDLFDNVSVYTDVWAKWKIDDGPWSSPTSANPYGCITTASGSTHSFFVHAEDFAGNTTEKSASFVAF